MGHMASLHQDEIDARRVLDAVVLPADVLGYGLRLGEFGDNPALWITFRTSIPDDAPLPELQTAAARLNGFADQVQAAMMHVLPDRFPYVAFTAGP